MKDRDFLIWLHARLQNIHKENPLLDYMHKLRSIIEEYPKEKISHGCSDNLKELLEKESE